MFQSGWTDPRSMSRKKSNSSQTSSSAGPSLSSSTPQSRNQLPHHNSGTVTIRGFETRHPYPLTPVIEAPTPAPTAGGEAPHSGTDYFGANAVRRRSSFGERRRSIADIGGVNSLNNFARSWQRAAGFYEITPVPRSFVLNGDDNNNNNDEYSDGDEREPDDEEASPRQQTSLLRKAIQNEHARFRADSVAVGPTDTSNEEAVEEESSSHSIAERSRSRRSTSRKDSIFEIEPGLTSIFGGSYGASYGSLSTRVNESAVRHAGRLFFEQQAGGTTMPDKEREPLLVKTVEQDDGKLINVVVGQSTLYQTVFNSVNVLIGVGMLALPLAMRYSGWVIGMSFFLFSAVTTSYTAKLLAKCLDVDGSLITFADLAYVSFGPRARVAVSMLFTLELVASCVALVVLFADSLDALIDGWDVTTFKVLCGVFIIPLGFLPLRFLSFTSIVGILSSILIVVAILVDGFVKSEAPGSLRHPMKTYAFPEDWRTVPLAFGLLMAPWGGHSVLPNIYRDMRHPHKYPRAINYTYVFTYLTEVIIGASGYLMFGGGVLDELTANIFLTEGYPHWLSIVIIGAVAIIPLTKIPLNARPIISTLEIFLGLDSRALPTSSTMAGMSGLTRGILKLTVRIGTPIVFIMLAIAVPSFDRILSLLGSLACFTICIILPCSFHLKIFGEELTVRQRCLDWFLVVSCTGLALAGTVCACLPKELLGVR